MTGVLQLAVDLRHMVWMDEGLCAETDPEAFFVEKGGDTSAAKRVCFACPVRSECLAFAMETESRPGYVGRFGVWGGTSAKERGRLAQRRAA